jgi:gluconate 2-dehydrogenase gamma chain
MLTSLQQTTLHALMDRIIPPDEDPGAWEAGVGDYLTRQFESDLRDSLDFYRAGLDALEAEAQTAGAASFAALPADQQDALLRRVEAGQVVHPWPVDPARFFQTAVQHVGEGYYSDPGNGGNRDEAAWRMIGYRPAGPERTRK